MRGNLFYIKRLYAHTNVAPIKFTTREIVDIRKIDQRSVNFRKSTMFVQLFASVRG